MLKSLRDFSVPPDGFMIAAVPQSISSFSQENRWGFHPPRPAPTCATPPKLLERLREALCSCHCNQRTEQSYCRLLEGGYDVRAVQELLGHKDACRPWGIKTTMIYTHVLNRGPAGVRSPVDGL
jgi:hypothetical protein